MVSDYISRRRFLFFLLLFFIAFGILITLKPPIEVIVEQPIILPTPGPRETVFLGPSPAPTVFVTAAPRTTTVIVREPGQRNTVIIFSPTPYPSPYPSPCDPTPVVGNC